MWGNIELGIFVWGAPSLDMTDAGERGRSMSIMDIGWESCCDGRAEKAER